MISKSIKQVRRQRGATLIEILVATFIASVGVMGLSKYQLESLVHTQQTQNTATVTWQLYSIVEKMRANPVAVEARDYLHAGKNHNCWAEECTPREIAEHDIWLWEQETKSLLTDGSAEIDQPGGAGNPYDVTIYWDGNRNGANGKGCDPANKEDLLCSSITVDFD